MDAGGERHYPHLYTIAEAQEMIPRVRRRLRSLRTLAQHAEEIERQLEEITPQMRANGSAARSAVLEQELTGIYQQMGVLAEGLVEQGIVLRDVMNGVVDFPCRHQGRVIMLCWQMDEAELGFWHEADTGFLTRQPLDRLGPDDPPSP